MRANFILALVLLISGFVLCTLYFVFLNVQIPEPFSSWSELPYAGMFQYAGLVCLLGAIIFLLMETREARRRRPIENTLSLAAICIVILANWISFFWGGYHTLLPTLFIIGLLGTSIVSGWVAVGMKIRDLTILLVVATLLAFADEYAHTSAGTLTYFDRAIPSPLTVFGWSPFMILLLAVTRTMTKIRSIYIRDQIRLRTLPVLASFILILTVAVLQGYVSIFNWTLALVYFVLGVASLYYTYMHSLKWNLLLMITSLVLGFSMEFSGRGEGLWTFHFMEPVSLLILFSWPLRIWTVSALCFLSDVDLSEKPFRTALFSSQMMEKGKSLIAVTDTHFGLRNDMFFEPQVFSGFLRWVRSLEERKVGPLRLGDWDVTRNEKALLPPEKIIMLGDILELWDASDRSIDICLRTFIPLFDRLECEKIYVLGNHDDILEEIASGNEQHYPLGDSGLHIIKKTYPKMDLPEEGEDGVENIRTLRVGNQEYLFIHGHQFDKHFADIGPAHRIIAYMREAAIAFGPITLLFVALFVVGVWLWLLGWSSPSPWMLVLLTLLAGPYISIEFARPVYNAFKSIRYNRLDPARVSEWWSGFSKGKEHPLKNLNIVCGHTHLIDMLPIGSPSMRLLNVPSWVKDEGSEKKRENVLRAAFLYIDEEGSAFMGWDWMKREPFFVPEEVITKRRGGAALTEGEKERLRAIGWPEKLLEEWGKKLLAPDLKRTRREALLQELRR